MTALLVILSHLEAWYNRLNYLLTPLPRRRFHVERRRNPRHCRLCGGPMRTDFRAGDILGWWRCDRCHKAQVGVH